VIAGGEKIVQAISEIVHRRSAVEEKVMRLEVRE
jgi:hypothetical protein